MGGFVTLTTDGIDAAAVRETEFHPKTAGGSQITAWSRRATTLKATVNKVNDLERRLAEMEARPVARPFP